MIFFVWAICDNVGDDAHIVPKTMINTVKP